MKRAMTAVVILAALTGGALAQEDPSWPCIQRKQPHLSVGQLWTGPLPDDATAELARRADIAALAQVLEQRRLSLEAAEAQIAVFAETADAAELTALFVAIFERIDAYRSEIISGIAFYAQKQTTLSAQIEARRQRMAELEANTTPDFDLIDAEEEKLDWDTRIFSDRQQQLTYVCESPVLLEQRAFSLAKAIAAHLPPVTPTPAP